MHHLYIIQRRSIKEIRRFKMVSQRLALASIALGLLFIISCAAATGYQAQYPYPYQGSCAPEWCFPQTCTYPCNWQWPCQCPSDCMNPCQYPCQLPNCCCTGSSSPYVCGCLSQGLNCCCQPNWCPTPWPCQPC